MSSYKANMKVVPSEKVQTAWGRPMNRGYFIYLKIVVLFSLLELFRQSYTEK